MRIANRTSDQPLSARFGAPSAARRSAEIVCQRLDDGPHAGAERSLDHDGVARLDGGRTCGSSAPRSRHSRPGARREGPPTARASAARSRTPDRCRARDRLGEAAVQVGARGPSSSMSPSTAMRRPRGPTRPGRAARARRASRPDWRCSSRRSAAPRRRADRAAMRAPRPAAGLSRRAPARPAPDRRRPAPPPPARRAN